MPVSLFWAPVSRLIQPLGFSRSARGSREHLEPDRPLQRFDRSTKDGNLQLRAAAPDLVEDSGGSAFQSSPFGHM